MLLTLVLIGGLAYGAYSLWGNFFSGGQDVPTMDVQADFKLDYEVLESWITPEMYDYTPEPGYVDTLRQKMEDYPQYSKGYEFFLEHIGAYSELDVKTLILSPEKIDFVLLNPFADRLDEGWSGELSPKGHGVPLFIQYDSRWAFKNYGSSCMGNTACGPTCLSMAAVALTGKGELNPAYVSDFAFQNGYYVDGSGTAWSFFTQGASQLGLSSQEIAVSNSEMKERLKNGEVLIASVAPGDFTMGGHFIVIRDCDVQGYYINDPSSIEKSSKAWSYEKLAPQIVGLWAISA